MEGKQSHVVTVLWKHEPTAKHLWLNIEGLITFKSAPIIYTHTRHTQPHEPDFKNLLTHSIYSLEFITNKYLELWIFV